MKKDFRVELLVLLTKYASHFDLSDGECRVLAKLMESIVSDPKEDRIGFYDLMSKYASERTENIRKESEQLLKSLNLSEDEEKILMAKVKLSVDGKDGKKVEN